VRDSWRITFISLVRYAERPASSDTTVVKDEQAGASQGTLGKRLPERHSGLVSVSAIHIVVASSIEAESGIVQALNRDHSRSHFVDLGRTELVG